MHGSTPPGGLRGIRNSGFGSSVTAALKQRQSAFEVRELAAFSGVLRVKYSVVNER